MNRKDTKQIVVTYNLVINFFIEIGLLMAGGFFLGRYLDRIWFDSKPILLILFMFLALVVALVNFIKRVLKSVNGGSKNEEK